MGFNSAFKELMNDISLFQQNVLTRKPYCLSPRLACVKITPNERDIAVIRQNCVLGEVKILKVGKFDW
jgi:hypothetical protein